MLKIERIILNSKPVTTCRLWFKHHSLPGLNGFSVYDVFHVFVLNYKREGFSMRAASISFNMILAIPASFLFICSLLPYLPISKQFFEQLEGIVYDLTPDRSTRHILSRFLNDLFIRQKTGLLSLGFLLTIFYASNAMAGVIRAFNRSIVPRPKTNFIKNRLRAIQLTLIIVLLLLGTMIISMGQGVFFAQMMKWLHVKNKSIIALIQGLRWIFILLLFFYSIAFIYKYAPTKKKRGRLLTPGAFIATILVILCTTIFSYWAQNMSNYSKFYGSIGSVMLIMLLVFFNSMMLLIGFEVNMAVEQLKSREKFTEGVY